MNNLYVDVKNLSKRFFIPNEQRTVLRVLKAFIKRQVFKEEFWVLRDVSFNIKESEKVALIGKNGAGKTTLLRIIGGIYEKTSGDIEVNPPPKILFKWSVGLLEDISVVENIYLFGAVHGMSRDFLRDKMKEMLDIAELYHLRFSPLKEISSGQRQRLALSVFFQNSGNFLIFDEGLGSIDKHFAKKCEEYFTALSSSDKTVIICSHDLAFLRNYCSRAVWLDNGQIRMTGRIDEVITEYERSS